MKSKKRLMMSSAMVPLVAIAGVAIGDLGETGPLGPRPAFAACSPSNPCAVAKCNPCAAAACNPCNPCAAANPCAVAKCNPCNPCAAGACNPCNPCNPCAAAKCNPCNPCNPCAAACNPCNPCNPCAAGGGAVSKKCVVPRLRTAAACNPCAVTKRSPCSPCNPCNPCAAAKCNPCNPCAAAKCNPCNPCAAAKCNPCNPCAAAKCNPCSPCNPCNPCAATGAPELSDAEVVAVYDCLLPEMKAAYAKSDNEIAVNFASYRAYSKQPYVSATHGGRFVTNYANDKGRAYGAYERAGVLPSGTKLAKPSFSVQGDGRVSVGPLFLMEKMAAGFNKASGDWRYTMIMPNGAIAGTTNGKGSKTVAFCIGCHMSVMPEQDSVMLLPEEYRVK